MERELTRATLQRSTGVAGPWARRRFPLGEPRWTGPGPDPRGTGPCRRKAGRDLVAGGPRHAGDRPALGQGAGPPGWVQWPPSPQGHPPGEPRPPQMHLLTL